MKNTFAICFGFCQLGRSLTGLFYTSFLTTYISIKNVKKKIVGDFLKFKLALHSFKTISVDIEIQ